MVAIFVKKGQVCEWSAKTGKWNTLDLEGTFSDPTLTRPLRVEELLDAAEVDNAVARGAGRRQAGSAGGAASLSGRAAAR